MKRFSDDWFANCLLALLCLAILPGSGGCGGTTRGTGGPRPTVSGTVTVARSGLPLTNANIVIVQTGETTTTDENGFFTIAESSFAGGALQIEVNGIVADIAEISSDAQSISVELRLEDDGSITTVSVDVDGDNIIPGDENDRPARTDDDAGPNGGTPNSPDGSPDDPADNDPLPPGNPPDGDDGGNDPNPPPVPDPNPDPPAPPPPGPNPPPPGDPDGNPPPTPPQQEFIQLPGDRIFNPIRANGAAGVEAYIPTASGLYSDSSLWFGGTFQSQSRSSQRARSTNVLPPEGSQIIVPKEVTLTVDGEFSETINAIAVYGTLRFDPSVNTKLRVGTLLIHPEGRLEIGTTEQSVAASVRAEIEIADKEIDAKDTEATSTGVIVLGEIGIHGSKATPNWTRIASEARAGHQQLLLEQAPEGWRAGDQLVLPDTRLIWRDSGSAENWTEVVTIAQVAGNLVVLENPLRFNHLGARDSDEQIQFLPHVARLNRNVLIHSENPEGTRGYIYLGDRAEVDIRNARFRNLGRTDVNDTSTGSAIFEFTERHVASGDILVFQWKAGQIISATGLPRSWSAAYRNGEIVVWNQLDERQEMELLGMRTVQEGDNQISRYAVTVKNLIGPENESDSGYQFKFVGNTIDASKMFGVGVVDSHFGLIENNVVFDAQGSGIAFREGNERGTDVLGNIAIRIHGTGSKPKNRHEIGENARSGIGFWQNLPKNNLRNNVSADTTFAGFEFGGGTAFDHYSPTARGIDKIFPTNVIHVRDIPSGRFDGNEAYGRTRYGFWVSNYKGEDTLVSQLTAWHNHGSGIYVNYGPNVRVEGFEVLCDQHATFAEDGPTIVPWDRNPAGVEVSHAGGSNLQIRYGSASGCLTGLIVGNNGGDISLGEHATSVSDVFLKNYENVTVITPRGEHLYEFDRIMTEQLDVAEISDSRSPRDLVMSYRTRSVNYIAPSKVLVRNFNGVNGDNFQLFFLQQHPSFVISEFLYHTGRQELPPGRTNQYYWDNHGVAVGGRLAPCLDTRAAVQGYVCPINE